MKKDIAATADIEFLIDSFYKKIIADEVIGYFFTKVVALDWSIHIPVMCRFWETVLFANISYKGNPIIKHIELNKQEPLQSVHFRRWLSLWNETIDEYFEGKKANEAKQKAGTMATLMMMKLQDSKRKNFIQ